jgi:hypothetical protein
LVYEDCERGCDVTVGRDVLDRIGPPLSLVLDSVRWAAGEFAEAARGQLRRCHAELRELSADTIDAPRVSAYVRAAGAELLQSIARPVTQRYQDAWQSVLQPDGGEQRRQYETAVAARARVRRSRPGWSRTATSAPA